MRAWILVISMMLAVGFEVTAQMLPKNDRRPVTVTGFPESIKNKKGNFLLGISPTNQTTSKSVEIKACWICYYEFGNILIGESTGTSNLYMYSDDPNVSISFGSIPSRARITP